MAGVRSWAKDRNLEKEKRDELREKAWLRRRKWLDIRELILGLYHDMPDAWRSFGEIHQSLPEIPKRTVIYHLDEMVKQHILQKEEPEYNKTFYRPILKGDREKARMRLRIIGFRNMLLQNVNFLMKETEKALAGGSSSKVGVETLVEDMCKSLRRWVRIVWKH